MDNAKKSIPAVLVHGGAGDIETSRVAGAISGCEQAAEAGSRVLDDGPLAAVIAAVQALENDPSFNAGYGSTLTRAGTVELDASVMTGDLRFGAIGACPPVESAIALASQVRTDGEHTLLTGQGALDFAAHHGIKQVPADSLITDRVLAQLEAERARRAMGVARAGAGTVGAVAVGSDGKVAAATSTGGILYKRIGRIGDTPVLGAGTYADDEMGAAASATGHGESIIKVLLCKLVVDGVGAGATPEQAASSSIATMKRRVNGSGGLIVIDKLGRFFAARNTKHMPWALADRQGIAGSGS
ncbi:MAG: isoaspartyl peptidase/L-asparaginase [Actinomycetota bacterium]|nr:isoaspartyl peptidase/L-asparaginase [Actinomycetota bacterium]